MTSAGNIQSKFVANQSGAIAPIFGLMMLVLAMSAGISVDTARSSRVYTVASSALDAAALAGAKALRLGNPTDAELSALVLEYFNSNITMNANGFSVKTFQVVPNVSGAPTTH